MVDLSKEPPAVRADAETRAAAAFQAVLSDAANIQHDHYLIYYTRAHPFLYACFPEPLLTHRPAAQTTSSGGCWRARATRRRRGGTSISSCLVCVFFPAVVHRRPLLRWRVWSAAC